MTDNAQIDDGRVIIDTQMWSTYNPDQIVDLEAFDNLLSEAHSTGDELLPFPSNHSGHDDYRLHEHGYPANHAIRPIVMSHRNRRRRPKDMQGSSMSTLGLNPAPGSFFARPDSPHG